MYKFEKKHDQYIIESHKQFPQLKVIRFDGSGTVDKSLRGQFTSPKVAMEAIDQFNKLKSEANANKAESTSRDKQLLAGTDNGSEPAKLSA